MQSLEARALALQAQKRTFVAAIADPGNVSVKPELLEQVASVKAEITRNESDLRNTGNDDQSLLEFASFALNYISELKDNFWDLEHEDRVGCVKMLFPDGFFIDKTGNISHPTLSPIFTLIEQNQTKKNLSFTLNSLLVELRGIAPRSVRLLASGLQV